MATGVQRGAHGLGWIYWGVGFRCRCCVAMAIWNFVVTRAVADAARRIGADSGGHRAPVVVGNPLSTPSAPADIFTTANELVMPTGMPVRLQLTSADVIHDFWVPKLGPEDGLIPG